MWNWLGLFADFDGIQISRYVGLCVELAGAHNF
jgi:hypothetical protein